MTQLTFILICCLVAIQISCLVVGLFQGFRYIRTEPLTKAGPWLLMAMVLSPILYGLSHFLVSE